MKPVTPHVYPDHCHDPKEYACWLTGQRVKGRGGWRNAVRSDRPIARSRLYAKG